MSPPFTAEETEEIANVSQDSDLGRPVRVMWIDSGLAVGNGWQRMDEIAHKSVETVETVGLWMGENDHIVMVGGSRDVHNHSWLGAQLIWKPSIQSKEFLA